MNIYNKESLMKLNSHILIQQLKRQPRIGNKLDDFNSGLNDLNNNFKQLRQDKTFKDLSLEINKFKQTLPGVSTVLSDMGDLLKSGFTDFEALSAGIGRAQAYQEEYNKSVLK